MEGRRFMKKRRLQKGLWTIILTVAMMLAVIPVDVFTLKTQAATQTVTKTVKFDMDGGKSGTTTKIDEHTIYTIAGGTMTWSCSHPNINNIYYNYDAQYDDTGKTRLRGDVAKYEGIAEFPDIEGKVTKVEITNLLFSYAGADMYVGKDRNDTSTLLHIAGTTNDYDFPSNNDYDLRSVTFEGNVDVDKDNPLKLFFYGEPQNDLPAEITFVDGSITITYEEEEEITEDPGHTFSYIANGNTLTATCNQNDPYHVCGLTDKKAILTLTANDTPRDPGLQKRFATLNTQEFADATGITDITSTFVYENKNTHELTSSGVVLIGDYNVTATIIINGDNEHPYTLTKDFKLFDGEIKCNYPQLSFSPKIATPGEPVTISFNPLAGESVKSLTATGETTNFSIGNGITDNGDGTFTFNMVSESLAIGATFSQPDASHFEQTGENEYTIKTSTGWRWFCFALNSGLAPDGFSGKTVKLATDVESSEMAGTSNHPFKGTFDGQNHTLTFNHEASEDLSAPFHYINGATISNLHVDGTITGGTYGSLGGLVGRAEGNITIENCHVSTQISTTCSGSAWHGGVIAQWNSTNATCTVTGCVYDGLIYNPDEAGVTTSCRGFIGWDYGNNGTIKFTDCLSAPAAYGTGKYALGDYCFTFVYPNSEPTLTYNMTNCYYTNTLGNRQGRPATTATIAPANLGNATTDHGLVKGYENGFLYNGNYYTPKYGDVVVEYIFTDYGEYADVTINGEGNNLVGVNITEDIEKVSSVTYNRTFAPGVVTTVILPFNYTCNGSEGGTFYSFKDVTDYSFKDANSDEVKHEWVCKMEELSNGSLTANTPYLFVPSATTMTFPNISNMTGGVVTLQPTTLNEYGGATTNAAWNFYGTYNWKLWTSSDNDYGFAAEYGTEAGGTAAIEPGQFVHYALGAGIGPMRCYLRYAGTSAFEGFNDISWWDGLDYYDSASFTSYMQISFSAGEGSGTKDVIYIPENRNYILPECNFSAPDGKAFKGWSVKIGDAQAVAKNPGDTITVTADTTVTALWAPKVMVNVIAKDIEGKDVVANITGNGEYPEGTKASLSAKMIEGYNFKGWYQHVDESPYYIGDPISTANNCEYTVEGEAFLTAVYEPLGSAQIKINGGMDFNIGSTHHTATVDTSYGLGTTLSVTAYGDYFAYWENGYGMILSRQRTYTFTVTGNDMITAQFNTPDTDKAIIIFESYYNQAMARLQLASGGTGSIPSIPYRNGYDPVGWDYNGDGEYDGGTDTLAAAIERGLATADKTVIVRPVYTLIAATFTISVTGGTGSGTYNQNDKVTVTANAPEAGKKFSHWKDGAGNIVSYNVSHQFFADRDLVLEAVYVDDAEVVEAKGTTEIISMSKNAETKKLIFVSLSTVPQECTIKKAGVIATDNATIASDANSFVDTASGVRVRGNEWSGTTYRYTWSMPNVSEGDTWYVRAYLVYVDKEGNTHTVYGAIVSQTF
jgi:hypothetical protein